ncbi:MAG: Ig-like domain-containing protein, partial [Clostridia bacterium]|nr:Ig-like domain-containing protein [Clostridia bacterium]
VARDGVTAEYTLTPVFTPAGVSEDKKFVYWECEGATGIDVDNGVVKAENDGTVTVTAIGHNGVKAIQVLTFISLDINPKTAIIERGEKLQIIPTITPAGTTTTCTFKTSNDAVASVDENGLVTGNSQGRAEITVQTTPDTNGEVMTKICSVEVTDLTLTPDKTIIKTGESNYALITARGTDRNLTYTSSDDTIAGVSVEANKKDAKVIGKKGGKVTITAIAEGTDEEIKAEVEINVVSIDKITYSDKIKNREVDKNTYDNDTEKSKYKAFCVINDGKEVDPVWTSSNEDVAEVSADGTLKIKANGTTTIRAAYPGDASIYEEATLNVGGLYIPSTVMADDGKIYMKPESQSEFTPTYSKGKAGEVFTYKVEPVGTIDKDKMTYSGGNGVGFKSGKDSEGKYNFTISVMQNDKVVAHAALTVVVLNVTVPSGTVYQAKGKTIAPSAIDIVINPANDTGKWTSSDEKIATVDEQSGLVTTVEAGTTNITYTCGGVSASYKVVVVEGAFAQKELALAIGDTANVKLNVTSNPAGIEYTSSDESIATVDESGKVTGIKAGKVTITGEFKGLVKDTCEVTVYDIKFPASDAPVYIPSGDSKSASELGINTPAGEGTWTSSDPSVATVDSFGKITTVGPGKTTITYELNGFKKTIEVVVFTVEMAESTYYTAVGDSVTLTFKLNDGGAGQTNPAGTVWTSSDDSTISVAGGKATALKAGKATITATYQGKSATATVYGIAAGQIVLTDSEKKVVSDELLIGNTYTATIKVSAPEGFESSKLAVTGFTAAGGNEYVKTISPSKVEKITVSADIQYNGNTMFTRTAAFDVADLVVKEGENAITSKTVTAGTSFTINATYTSSSGASKSVTAKSTNIEAATVSGSGNNFTVSTKRAGDTVITFSANNLEKKVNVTVAGVRIEILTIDNHGVSKIKRDGRNKNYQFGYTISPANAEAANVIWTSSNKEIAEVNNNGLVSVKNKPGKTVITVTVTDSTGATRSAATTLEVEMTLLERIVAFFRNIIETVVKLFTSAG